MFDSLLDLTPVWDVVGAVLSNYGGYLGVILGVYLALFILGIVVEAVRSRRPSE